jgi:hypothetical protein
MESLKEGVKFVFNNKTILGALSLDMVAVLLMEWHFTYFCSRYLKSRSRRLWGFESCSVGSFLTLIVSAYVPMNKNAGLKL